MCSMGRRRIAPRHAGVLARRCRVARLTNRSRAPLGESLALYVGELPADVRLGLLGLESPGGVQVGQDPIRHRVESRGPLRVEFTLVNLGVDVVVAAET